MQSDWKCSCSDALQIVVDRYEEKSLKFQTWQKRGDTGIYHKIHIQSKRIEERFEKKIKKFGQLLYGNAGLAWIAVESDVFALGSVQQIRTGKDFERRDSNLWTEH